jgi:hypothetical protein
LTFQHDESKVGIAAIGGVEVVVKVMKTFPKCQMLQEGASGALCNLTCRNAVGQANAIESGGIDCVLAAINNHLGSAFICKNACWLMFTIVTESKENTGQLISLGGATAVAKVRTKWPDNNNVQTPVRKLANMFAVEMEVWAD